MRQYHERLSSPIPILQPDGEVKTFFPNPSSLATTCRTLIRLMTEKIQPGSPLYDTARGFFAEYIGPTVLGDVARKSRFGEFCVIPAPFQCDTANPTQDEKSADVLLAKKVRTKKGEDAFEPIVLFEVKASQRNSVRNTGVNCALGQEIPVVNICLGHMPLGEKTLASEYFAEHAVQMVDNNWFEKLSPRDQKTLTIEARHAVTKGCLGFLSSETCSERRMDRSYKQHMENLVGLAVDVLGVPETTYIQYTLGN